MKGKSVKAVNQYFNKKRAHVISILRQGKQPQEGVHTSKRLTRLHRHRFRRIYEKGKKESFTGKRVHRGLYRSPQGTLHADVNGAANILRKVVPTASAYGIEGLDGNQSVNVSTPQMLSIR